MPSYLFEEKYLEGVIEYKLKQTSTHLIYKSVEDASITREGICTNHSPSIPPKTRWRGQGGYMTISFCTQYAP